MADKHAQVPITLHSFARELRHFDPDLVAIVLKQELPILKGKVKRLDDNDEVTSNFSYNLGLQDKAEQEHRDFGVHRMPEEEFEEMQAGTKKDKEDYNKLEEDCHKLRGKYLAMK
jgi:hypothetical protein